MDGSGPFQAICWRGRSGRR